jgi:hypothetical protein
MSDPMEIQRIKLSTLTRFFTDLGYRTTTKIGQNEFRIFLNKKSPTGRFDPLLSDKLFEVLNLDEMSTMSVEEFITGFIQFEEEVKKNAEMFNIKLAQEQEIYDKILKQCRLYQSEKLNAEGFCENAKIFGEITDINIKERLEGIKEIIIIIIYNDKKEELRFRIGGKNSDEMLKKTFSFKPTSRKDHFEFIMKGLNEKDQIFDIGSKVFPLDDIGSQEEYLVQIIIPEMGNPEKIVAYINTKIVLYMSDFKYYESLRKKQEKRLKKYKAAASKAAEYLKYVREIYGDLSVMKSELIVDFNNEKLMQRKGAKLNVNFNNMMEEEASGGNYLVEYNNEREVEKRGVPLRVEFNNTKEVLSPVTQTQNYEYKYNYSSSVNQNVIDNLEKRIELLKNERETLMNNMQKIPKPNSNIEQVTIKKTTEIIRNQEQQKTVENKDIPIIDPNQVISNEQIINEQIKSQQITSEPKAEPIILPPQANSEVLQKITTTKTTTQNISTPQYTVVNPALTGTKFDIDSYLQQTTTQTQNISSPQIILTNTTQDNVGTTGYIQQTTKTTETTTTSPLYTQNIYGTTQNEEQNAILQSVNGEQNLDSEAYINSFLRGQNINQYNIGNATTTTTTTTTNQYDLSNINSSSNGQYQTEQGIGYGIDETGGANEYQITGNGAENIKILKPIINEVQVNSSYNNAIFNETTNKALISENTLPVSYLPDKINEVIFDDKVTTLPVITHATESTTYNTLQPIIHESQTIFTGENSGANYMNYGENNITGSSYGAEYNFSSGGGENAVSNVDVNGISDNNFNMANFNTASNGNNYFTTQTTETTTTTQYNQSYNAPIEGTFFQESQKVEYSV